MSLAVKLSLLALLLGSVLFAYLGPPPRRRAGLPLRAGMLAAGFTGYVVAAAVVAAGSLVAGALTLALAGELICAAGWLSRGDAPPSDDDGDDGGGGGGRGPKPPPLDWDAFERAFQRYARERDRQSV